MIVSGRVSHKMAPALRQVYDQMLLPKWVMAMGACSSSGGMFANYAILQGVDKSCRWTSRARLPAAAGGRDRRAQPDPEEDSRGCLAGLRPGEVKGVTSNQLAKAVNSVIRGAVKPEKHADMPALTVKKEHLVEVCRLLRDQHGKNFLSAVSAVDYLGYGEPVAGTSAPSAAATSTPPAAGAPQRRPPRPKSASAWSTTWPTTPPAADRPTGCG